MKPIIKKLLFLCLILTNFSSVSAELPPPLRYFTFDEGFTESMNGYKPEKVIGNPSFVAGISGQALQLDGKSALIYDSSVDLNLEQFTLTSWLYFDDKKQSGSIVGKGDDSYWIFFNFGEIKSGFLDAKYHECRSGIYLQPQQWYFLSVTYDGVTLRSYVNDHLDSIKIVSSAPRKVKGALMIGAEGNTPPNHYFRGIIDEVRIYNESLSTAEIRSLYKLNSE